MEPIKHRGFAIQSACTEEPAGIWWPRAFIQAPRSGTEYPVAIPRFERSRQAAEDIAVALAKHRIDRAFERRKP